MKKWMFAFALTLAFSLVSVAQSGSSSSASDQSSSGAGSSASTPSSTSSDQSAGSMGATSSTEKSSTSTGKSHNLTGCLEQGSTPGTYVIKDAKHPEGVQVSYSGSEDLSKHVGHKVKASGTLSGDTMTATNIKHISETCSMGSASSGKHDHSKANSSTDTSAPKSDTSNPK